jgi:hypothetical protein
MTLEQAIALLGVSFGLLVLLVALVWRTHENHDKDRDKAIWDQVGRDSQSGMRRTVHQSANMIQNHEGEIASIKRDVEKIDRKVFNGK